MKDHQPNCPRLQFWDGGEWEVPCLCEPTKEEELKEQLAIAMELLEEMYWAYIHDDFDPLLIDEVMELLPK